jgi:hypothetical protein
MMADELQANGGTGLLEWGMPETQGAEDEGLQANAQNDGSEASAVQD